MTEAKRETKCNMDYKIFLILSLILLTPLISATSFGYNYLDNQPSGNITNIYENNTYINQTIELNSTQFETGEPATIKKSWLTSFIESISKWANYYTITEIDNRYSNNTGDQNLSTYVQGNMSSETTYQNISESVSGYSLSFDGVNDYVLTNNVIPINDGNFTIGLWFKTISSSNEFMIDNGDTSSPSNYLSRVLIGIHSDYKIRFYAINENSSDFNIYSPNTYNDGNWHLAVFTKSSNNFTGYVDGVNVGSATKEGNFGNRVFAIGRSQIPKDTTRYFNGSIDEVLIFNRSLNSTEVEQIYNSGVGLYANTSIAPFNEGLVSGWHFDEGTGTTAFDLTGRNNGTLRNGPTYTTGKVNHTETTTIEVLGAIGLMPWVSATNFISTDFSLQWIGNTLKNPWNTISQLGNSTNRWNVHLNNVTMNGTQGWSGNCINSSILNGIIVGCND